ncbi:uncharacterized protein [Penaeus vannamei]|uniref:uncharacterized protein n=1 Tax=Penaeus vannamei TaxID=6689 RepID=UPI00387F5D75
MRPVDTAAPAPVPRRIRARRRRSVSIPAQNSLGSHSSSLNAAAMKVLSVLALVCALVVSVHSFECTNAGTFADLENNCRGFHICSFNGEGYDYVRYLECKGDKVYNGHTCVPPSDFDCGSASY